MATVQAGAALSLGSSFSSSTTTRVGAFAGLAPASFFGGMPASIFSFLATLLDQQSADPVQRSQAITYLMVYQASTLADDKNTAVLGIEKMHDDALLLLDHLWGIFGPSGIPIDRPSDAQLGEIKYNVITGRSKKNLKPLKTP
jgi:hypothetical protein